MQKFTRTEITDYALYLYMKTTVGDFDTIFLGQKIINKLLCRYDYDGSFDESVLKLMPLLELPEIKTEDALNSWVDKLTTECVDKYFIEIQETNNSFSNTYYVRNN